MGAQQRVEILKALYRNAELLILDEPTAVLTPDEANELFRTIKALSEHGLSVILITHKLEEVTSRLRPGDCAARRPQDPHRARRPDEPRRAGAHDGGPRGAVDRRQAAGGPWRRDAFGGEPLGRRQPRAGGLEERLARRARARDPRASQASTGTVRPSWSTCIMGMRRGNVRPGVRGRARTSPTARRAQILQRKVACVPPDRQHMGLFLDFTVAENLISRSLWEALFARWGFLRGTIDRRRRRTAHRELLHPHAEP